MSPIFTAVAISWTDSLVNCLTLVPPKLLNIMLFQVHRPTPTPHPSHGANLQIAQRCNPQLFLASLCMQKLRLCSYFIPYSILDFFSIYSHAQTCIHTYMHTYVHIANPVALMYLFFPLHFFFFFTVEYHASHDYSCLTAYCISPEVGKRLVRVESRRVLAGIY